MKLEDLSFSDKQAKRILAEASEREARDDGDEDKTISYSQLVQIAEESQINPKYLKVSTKQLVKESGGLENAVVSVMAKKTKKFSQDVLGGFLRGYLTFPTAMMSEPNDSINNIGKFIGGISYLGSVVGALAGWREGSLFPQGLYLYLGIGAVLGTVTQVSSGIYEWYKYEKNNLIEKMNGSDAPASE